MWSSGDPDLATVNAEGVVNSAASSTGSTLITATSGSVTGSTLLTFSPPQAIQVTPANATLAPGTTGQLSAAAVLQNSSQQDLTGVMTWESSDPGVATVSGTGLVSAAATTTGTTTVTATFSGITGTAQISSSEVRSIRITPDRATLVRGTTRNFTARGILSNNAEQDLTTEATWNASPSGIAVMDGNGLALAVSPGTALITASFGAASGSALLTVTEPSLVSIKITPVNQSINQGETRLFLATGIFSDGSSQNITDDAAWATSDAAIATVSNAAGTKGLVQGLAAGTARINASFSGVTSDDALVTVVPPGITTGSISITPANPRIRPGETVQFSVTALFPDGTVIGFVPGNCIWTSSNGSVAFVAQGLATGLGMGTTIITFTSGTMTGSTVLTVTSF